MDMKRLKIHPGKMTKERDAVCLLSSLQMIIIKYLEYSMHVVFQVESCSADVYKGIQSNCLEQFEAVKACLSDNPKEWAACAAMRKDLDVCSVRSGLGEIKKAL